MTFTLGSLFDGSGGFPLAGTLCGIMPLWASEVEPYPIAVTKSRFPDMKHLGDISKINGAEIHPVDIITFGSPCQDLSIAGKRAGLKHSVNGDKETTRSGLFMEAIRIIKEMRCATNGKYPRFALWENVPGAFSSNKGEDFRIVLEELIKISEAKATVPPAPKGGWPYADAYVGDGWSLAYRTFDAQYWGVPQRRRRIYLVTDFIGGCASRVLFEREGVRGYFAKGKSPWQGIASNAERSVGTNDCAKNCLTTWDYQTRRVYDSEGKWPTLTAGAITSGQNQQAVLQPIDDFSNVASTLRAGEGAPKHNADLIGRHVAQSAIPKTIDVEMEVTVRKFNVDRDGLATVLRKHKGNKTNSEIAQALNKPLTLVEHWFRKDKSFAVPEPDVWFELKELLGITTTEYDQSITELQSKNSNYDLRNRIYASEISPTLTCGCGEQLHFVPEKNMLEDAVTQSLILFEPRSQDGVPRIHNDVSPTLNTAQGGQRQPCVALPVYCVQGNCIDRSDTAGCNGKDWREGECFTLNTIDRPAVVYCMASGQAHAEIYENKCPTLNCTAEQPIITKLQKQQDNNTYAMTTGSFMQICKNVSPTLAARDYKGPHLACYWDGSQSTGTITANNASVNQRMPDKCNFSCVVEKSSVKYIVRRLTPIECARLQGFADTWGIPDYRDNFTSEEYHFWLAVRNGYASINGKRTKEYTKPQMLTWYNKLHSDSSEYKMWGNGIALPTALYCMQGIYDALAYD